MTDNTISNIDLLLAEQLLARGNDVKTVAALLGVTQVSLAPLTEKAKALAELRAGYLSGDPEVTFSEWSQDVAARFPVLELNEDRPWLSVAGMARREGWGDKGFFQQTATNKPGSGRVRADNSDEKLVAAAKTALTMAETDKKLNLKLAQIRAAADHGVTDIAGMTKILREVAPTLWRPRK